MLSMLYNNNKIALVDCNSFYVSCERLFNPSINKKPVVVLSSNDGCVISRSTEAKSLGIKMGEPYFKVKKIVEENKVNIFYTAPTAIRSLESKGSQFISPYNLSSLKVLGTVGEPINEDAWHWYDEEIGKGNCPIVDTWWQTETGGILISPQPGAIDLKPGSAT